MKQIRYLLSFLLLAGVAGAHAQPIVKITTTAGECDVSPTNGEIFHLDTNGNVLITGTMGTPINTGCTGGGGTGGGTGTVTFNPLSPAPSPLTLSPNTFTAGSGSSLATYSAAYATSCTLTAGSGTAVPSGSGSCPSVTIANGSCSSSSGNCSGSGTVTEPTTLPGSTTTSCNYTLTATCAPGGVVSTASLSVTKDVVTPPTNCPNLSRIGTGTANQYWTMVTSTSVKFGDGTVKSGVDGTDYVSVWSYPGTNVPWPGTKGLTTRPSASVNQYFAEKFVVPTDGSVTTNPNWALSGSGINANASLTVSACPGDFGQTGTQLTTGCKVNQNNSSSGLTVAVGTSQVGSFCTVVPGQTYYLNLLPMAPLPSNNVSISSCSGTCTPWFGRN